MKSQRSHSRLNKFSYVKASRSIAKQLAFEQSQKNLHQKFAVEDKIHTRENDEKLGSQAFIA